jgi:hypothetical protein
LDDLDGLGPQLAEIDRTLVDQLSGAIDMAIDTARNRVGAKVRSAIRHMDLHDEITSVPNSDVPSKLGVGITYESIDDIDQAVRTSLEPLGIWWDRRVQDAIAWVGRVADLDTSTPLWRENARRSRVELIENLTTWVVTYIERSDDDLPSTPIDIARNTIAVLGGSLSEPPLIGAN